MDDFRQWCRLFIVIVAAGGIIEGLLPKIKVASAFKTLFSVIVISVLLTPLSDNLFTNAISSAEIVESEIGGDVLYGYRDDMINGILADSLGENIVEIIKQYDGDSALEKLEIEFSGSVVEKADIVISGDFDDEEKVIINDYLYGIFGGVERVEFK